MGKDLSEANKDYAIYLPSISSAYSHNIIPGKHGDDGTNPIFGRKDGLYNGMDTLDFLNEDKGAFYYKWALYSAGHAVLDTNKSDITERMVQKRAEKQQYDKGLDQKTVIVGDSGGFQIGKGVIKFDWERFYEKPGDKDYLGTADKVRNKIFHWLEHTSDYSMTLDIPPWAIGNIEGIESFEECLNRSSFNLDYFTKRRQYKCKFINILQGRTLNESDRWYEHVKHYDMEGWAMAGQNMRDFELVLKRFVTMYYDGTFGANKNTQDKYKLLEMEVVKGRQTGNLLQVKDEEGNDVINDVPDMFKGHKRNWIHFLGQSRLSAGVALTILQRKMREVLDDKEFIISYDSATPFISTSKGCGFVENIFSYKDMKARLERMPDDRGYVGGGTGYDGNPGNMTLADWIKKKYGHKTETEMSKLMTLADLCVKTDPTSKSSWRTFSYIMLMGHNTEWLIDAIQEANRRFDNNDTISVPLEFFQFADLVDEIFDLVTLPNEKTKEMQDELDVLGRKIIQEQIAEVSTDKTKKQYDKLFTKYAAQREKDLAKAMKLIDANKRMLHVLVGEKTGKGLSDIENIAEKLLANFNNIQSFAEDKEKPEVKETIDISETGLF